MMGNWRVIDMDIDFPAMTTLNRLKYKSITDIELIDG